jgi:membrane associated rhomboid family serine protease
VELKRFASIAVSSLVGVAVVFTPNRGPTLLLFAPLGLVIVIYLIFNAFVIILYQTDGIAYPSHVIGFSIGVILGLAWRNSFTSNQRKNLRIDFSPSDATLPITIS